jgi:hypothetical protein
MSVPLILTLLHSPAVGTGIIPLDWLQSILPPIFPRLRQLVLEPVEIQLATKFLRSFSNSPLVSVQISLKTCVPVAETDDFFEALRMASSHAFLKSLTLRNKGSGLSTVERRRTGLDIITQQLQQEKYSQVLHSESMFKI